ncbi:MAG TPA: extracellular solute-binding protein [Rhodocyclaceae bacterium]|nr:extracellular solute-binding protein [Rhodocyclaceae bacterium]
MSDGNSNNDGNEQGGLSRRGFIMGLAAAGGAAAMGGIKGISSAYAAEPVVLRLLGTGVTHYKEIADQAKKDLGITIEYTTLNSDDAVNRAITQPTSYDLLDSEYFALKKIIPSGNLRGMDVKRIKNYEDIVSIFTTGQFGGRMVSTQGTAPFEVSYLDGEFGRKFSAKPTDWMTVVPTVYNADTLGIRPDLVPRPVNSWADLLSPDFKGKTAIINVPSIGIMDAAMAIEAMGKMHYHDKGNMTRSEIDKTIEILTEAKKRGQFRAFWKDFNESVNLMASGEVVLQSMWSPAVSKVREMGIACKYQTLKEGYRGWGIGLGIPSHVKGRTLDAAYEFVNWYLSGWAGAFLNRQGYYTAVPKTAKQFMSADEWAYWMEGKAAKYSILSPTGQKVDAPGSVRDGGSFEQRMGAVACWNTVMDEDRYLVRKWNDFVAA